MTEAASYGEMLEEIGRRLPAVVVIDAGLATSMQTERFRRAFPGRYFNLGVAEQNAVGVAAGLARRGLVPLVHSFANFLVRRAHDQIAISVAWPRCNVKLIAGSCGVFDARNGPSHTAVDDLSVVASLPGVRIAEPGDALQTRDLLFDLVERDGPAYLRLRRFGAPYDLRAGRRGAHGTTVVSSSPDARCTLVAAGSMLEQGIGAAARLGERGVAIDLIHTAVLRPFEAEPVLASATRTGRVVTVENHVPSGGFGDCVARAVGPLGLPVHRLSVPDEFLPAGDPAWQLRRCGLDAEALADRIAGILIAANLDGR